jgi:golgin subfamily B member 1
VPPAEAADDHRKSARPPEFAAQPLPAVDDPRDHTALRGRFQHYWGIGALDEATQVARALVHLGRADAVERRLAALDSAPSSASKASLSPELLRTYLAHEDEDLALGRVLAAIWPAFLQMRARPERDAGLRPQDEIDPRTGIEPVGTLFAEAARTLGITCPRLFLRRDVPGGMAHLHVMPVASLCGGTLASAFDAPSTLHVFAHHISMYRPEAYLFALAPAPRDQLTLVLAALHLEGRLESVDPRVASIGASLSRHMLPIVRDALHAACAELTSIEGDEPWTRVFDMLQRFRRGVYLTAVRAGYLASGDLTISERMQRVMPAIPGITLDEQLEDMVTYSVSASWFALRRALGMARSVSQPSIPAASDLSS